MPESRRETASSPLIWIVASEEHRRRETHGQRPNISTSAARARCCCCRSNVSTPLSSSSVDPPSPPPPPSSSSRFFLVAPFSRNRRARDRRSRLPEEDICGCDSALPLSRETGEGAKGREVPRRGRGGRAINREGKPTATTARCVQGVPGHRRS